MDYTVVTMPSMIVAGSELRTTWIDNACVQQIPAFWQEQFAKGALGAIENKVSPNTIVGMYTNYTPDFSLTSGYYSLIIGAPVSSTQAQSNLVITEIPETKYAVFTTTGGAMGVYQTWMRIWQDNNLERAFTHDFEWYDITTFGDENAAVKIYISIK